MKDVMWIFWDRPMAEPLPVNPFGMGGIMKEPHRGVNGAKFASEPRPDPPALAEPGVMYSGIGPPPSSWSPVSRLEQYRRLEREYIAAADVKWSAVGSALVGALVGWAWLERRRRATITPAPPPPLVPHGAEARGLTDAVWCPGPAGRSDCEHSGRGWYHPDGTPCRGWRHWLHL